MVCERIHHVDVLDASHRGPPRVQRRVAVHVRLRRTKMCQHVVADVDGLHPKKRAEEMEPRAAFTHRRHAKAGLTAVHIHDLILALLPKVAHLARQVPLVAVGPRRGQQGRRLRALRRRRPDHGDGERKEPVKSAHLCACHCTRR